MREKDKYCKDCGKYIDHEECTDLENILRTELAATKEKLARAEKIIGFTDGLLKVGPFMPASHSKTHLIKMIKAYREVESE